MRTQDALRLAQEKDLDLVEVAPEARPPVTRILDYSKYKYEQAQKQKAARKHQTQINVREIKFRPKIAQHDYDTKKGHVLRFLNGRDKVKVTIMFRGREMSHPERGRMLLERLAEDVSELGVIESAPIQDGRNMVMLLAPVREIADAKPEPAPSAKSKPAATPEAAQPEAEPAPPTAEAPAAAAEPETENENETMPEAEPEATTPEQPAAAPKAAKVTKEAKEAAPKATAEAKPATPRKKPAAKAKPAAATAEPAQDEPAAAAPEPTSD